MAVEILSFRVCPRLSGVAVAADATDAEIPILSALVCCPPAKIFESSLVITYLIHIFYADESFA